MCVRVRVCARLRASVRVCVRARARTVHNKTPHLLSLKHVYMFRSLKPSSGHHYTFFKLLLHGNNYCNT